MEFVIMASGPSMCAKDAELVKRWRDGESRKAIAINTTYRLAPWADLIYACDHCWWKFYIDEVRQHCSGEFWCYEEEAEA